MNLFATPMSAPDADKITTCEKKRVAWNKGMDQLDPVTRLRVNAALKNSSPVKEGYVFSHSKKYNGKSVLEWAKLYNVHNATAAWHLTKYGNMDRCLQDYHKKRTVIHWGKSAKEWAEFIDEPGLTAGHVREATRKGKEHFERYLSKKIGKVIKLKEAK